MELDLVSYTLGEGDKKRLNDIIENFVAKAEADTVIIFDKAGRVLVYKGERLSETESEFMASIMSALFFASEELGNILDKNDSLDELIYETKKRIFLISRLENDFLVGVVSDRKSNLGSVRLFFKHLITDLNDTFRNIKRVDKQVISISSEEIEKKLREALS